MIVAPFQVYAVIKQGHFAKRSALGYLSPETTHATPAQQPPDNLHWSPCCGRRRSRARPDG
jgi:hypothetical protein